MDSGIASLKSRCKKAGGGAAYLEQQVYKLLLPRYVDRVARDDTSRLEHDGSAARPARLPPNLLVAASEPKAGGAAAPVEPRAASDLRDLARKVWRGPALASNCWPADVRHTARHRSERLVQQKHNFYWQAWMRRCYLSNAVGLHRQATKHQKRARAARAIVSIATVLRIAAARLRARRRRIGPQPGVQSGLSLWQAEQLIEESLQTVDDGTSWIPTQPTTQAIKARLAAPLSQLGTKCLELCQASPPARQPLTRKLDREDRSEYVAADSLNPHRWSRLGFDKQRDGVAPSVGLEGERRQLVGAHSSPRFRVCMQIRKLRQTFSRLGAVLLLECAVHAAHLRRARCRQDGAAALGVGALPSALLPV